MKDKFVKILLGELNRIELTAGIVKQDLDEKYFSSSTRLIPIDKVLEMVADISCKLDSEKQYLTPKTKFLYVEDGSVDVDELSEELFVTNPEIKVIVYRQGSHPPIFKEGLQGE